MFSFILFKVYKKGKSLFNGVADALKNLRSQFPGSTLNLQYSVKEFSDIENMLELESSEFEVGFFFFARAHLTRYEAKCPLLSNSFHCDSREK